MKIRFLGTAAAEGFPGLFCRCEACAKARKLGGKNIRTRTSVLIDDSLKIDFPADTYLHMLRDDIDLSLVTDLLITHSHQDHLYPPDLAMRRPIYAHNLDHPLNVYGNDLVIHHCKQAIPDTQDRLAFHRLVPFKTVDIGLSKVTPLLADHNKDETCLIFYIERGGKKILHGHDSGWFPEETWNWLKGKTLDLAILECTNGPLPGYHNHLNIEGVSMIQKTFKTQGILSSDGKIAVTHFSHNCGMLHDELAETFNRLGIEVAYDGMVIQL